MLILVSDEGEKKCFRIKALVIFYSIQLKFYDYASNKIIKEKHTFIQIQYIREKFQTLKI